MRDQLHGIMDRPISRRQARRAFVLSASAIVLVAGVLISLAGRSDPRQTHHAPPSGTVSVPLAASPPSNLPRPARTGPRQDPQDRRGSRAAHRALQALATDRPLQHVPYRDGRVGVELTGAREGHAVLTITAPSRTQGRAGWRRFLRRFHDSGRAYDLHLKVEPGGRHG